MNKTYILDTNVLLSDSNALFSFQENNIILPFIVIEELDRHKDRQDDVGRNARETARRLSLITKQDKDLTRGVSLGEGLGTLRVLSLLDAAAGKVIEIPSELEEIKSGDNRIVKFCLNYINNADKNENVILVTRDILLQLKCISMKINVEDYKKFNVASDAHRLYSGCTTVSDVDVSDFYTNHADFRLAEEVTDKLQPNEFVILRDSAEGSSSAVTRFIHKDKPLRKITKKILGKFETRNKEQEFAIDLLLDQSVKLVTLVGSAGTGKTLCALAAGLEQVIGNGGKGGAKLGYKSLVVCRPIQPVGKDIGFLPGTLQEKMEPWIAPIKDNLRYLITEGKKGNFNDEILQEYFDQGIIEVEAMAFIRGRSIANAFIIIDEAQNLNLHELKTILTRVGENTKIVLTGDICQIDNMYLDSTSNGLAIAVEKFKQYSIAGHVTLTKGERSELATLAARVLE